MADLDAILRRLKVNTAPAAGTGATGLGYTGGGDASSGLNPNYNPVQGLPQANFSPPVGYSNVDDMSFDRDYQTNYDALQRRLADAGSQYDTSNQQDDEEYQRAIREAGQQQDLDAAALTDRMANQGILRSGIQVKAQGDLANSYQNRRSDFDRQRSQAKTNRESAYTGVKRDVQDQIALLQNERTSREAAKQEAIARKLAEKQAQDAEALQRGQPQVTPTGTLVPGMGFDTTPRTVVGGQSNLGITESPLFMPNKFGLSQPAQQQAGVIPGFEQLPPAVQDFLHALAASRG